MTAIELGPVVLSSPRFAAILGLAVFLIAAHVAARREPRAADWAWAVAVLVPLGARFGWVAENLGVYAREPLTAFHVWQGGFSPLWGLLVGAVYTFRAGIGRTALPLAATGLVAWGLVHLATAPAPGETVTLPRVTLTTIDGEPAPLDTGAGRPVVVNLWAPWCPPCRRETPMMMDVAARRTDVDFAYVDQGTGAADVRSFLDRYGLPVDDVRLDPRRFVAAELGAVGLPTTLVFSSEGELLYRHVGEISRAELERRLDRAVP